MNSDYLKKLGTIFFLGLLFAPITSVLHASEYGDARVKATGGVSDSADTAHRIVARAFNSSIFSRNSGYFPGCVHGSFRWSGRWYDGHLTQKFDPELGTSVFVVHSHPAHDDDSCTPGGGSHRARSEIAVTADARRNLKATYGQTYAYSWKFKLPDDFKPTHKFTHIFQLKNFKSRSLPRNPPILSLTPRAFRNGAPDRMQVLFGDMNMDVVKSLPLSEFRGTWVEVYVEARFESGGYLEIEINRVADGARLLSWEVSDSNVLWPQYSDHFRPLWGIYRRTEDDNGRLLDGIKDEVLYIDDIRVRRLRNTAPPPPPPFPPACPYYDPVTGQYIQCQ